MTLGPERGGRVVGELLGQQQVSVSHGKGQTLMNDQNLQNMGQASCWFARDAMVKHQRPGDSHRGNVLCHSSGGWNPTSRCQQGSCRPRAIRQSPSPASPGFGVPAGHLRLVDLRLPLHTQGILLVCVSVSRFCLFIRTAVLLD